MTILTAVGYGILCALALITLYVLWAIIIYRYDKDRLGNKALARYQSTHVNPPEGQHYAYNNVWTNRSIVICDIELRNSRTQQVIKSERVQYKLATTCELLDLECLNIA